MQLYGISELILFPMVFLGLERKCLVKGEDVQYFQAVIFGSVVFSTVMIKSLTWI